MVFDDLYKNPFVNKVLNDSGQILTTENVERAVKGKIPGRERLAQKEKYIVDSFLLLSEIMLKVNTLNFYSLFIDSYRYTKKWKMSLTHADHIRYHNEAYINNIVGIFDRCLILLNHIYKLGLPEKELRFNTVMKHKAIQNKKIKNAIIAFRNTISGMKELRNYTVHQGIFLHSDLDSIANYEVQLVEESKINKKPIDPEKILDIKKRYLNFIKGAKEDVINNNKIIYQLCDIFFTDLDEEYAQNIKG